MKRPFLWGHSFFPSLEYVVSTEKSSGCGLSVTWLLAAWQDPSFLVFACYCPVEYAIVSHDRAKGTSGVQICSRWESGDKRSHPWRGTSLGKKGHALESTAYIEGQPARETEARTRWWWDQRQKAARPVCDILKSWSVNSVWKCKPPLGLLRRS